MGSFEPEAFLPASVLARITSLRVDSPDQVLEVAGKRPPRRPVPEDGMLCLIAADHPARGVTAVGDKALGMADRQDYLARIVRVLAGGAVDGVMATMDVIDDLFLLHHLILEAGGPGLLDGKWLVPSLNRAGLSGADWELNDPLTGASPDSCVRLGMDGAKALLRICPGDRDSLATIEAVAAAITELNSYRLPFFLEPLPVVRRESRWEVVKEAEALARIVGVASALGDSSRYLWLKLPWCSDFGRVAASTTLPILLLGGPQGEGLRALLAELADGLAAGANVRGTLLGRRVLYPDGGDPLVAARAVAGLVHKGWSLERAERSLGDPAEGLDTIHRWFD
ncbi:MAG: deoxyribose-phosphate aldolase [Myxococcota bacterium]|nr:deoxyribose-phosphate aldolase [Myxococcota bacterium]